MWYVKNLPGWERVLRFAGALAMASCAWRYRVNPVGWIFGGLALIAAVTALVGFCPMCRFAGRPALNSDKAESQQS